MPTWGDLLADLREDLQDTSPTNPAYTSKMLWLYARDAVKDYSQFFPLRVDALEIAGVDERYALPADFIDEIFVECPRGTFLEPRVITPGIKKVAGTTVYRYEIIGGGIYLDAATDESIWLTYSAYHTFPTSETASTTVISVPLGDIELIHLYVRARITTQVRARTANLDRYKEDGRRDDNPMAKEYNNLMGEYHRKIMDRERPTAIHLRSVRG
jgi:hypothetical protein